MISRSPRVPDSAKPRNGCLLEGALERANEMSIDASRIVAVAMRRATRSLFSDRLSARIPRLSFIFVLHGCGTPEATDVRDCGDERSVWT